MAAVIVGSSWDDQDGVMGIVQLTGVFVPLETAQEGRDMNGYSDQQVPMLWPDSCEHLALCSKI